MEAGSGADTPCGMSSSTQTKLVFSCLPEMYYIRRQQSLLQRVLFIKPNIFQAFWDIEALLQLLTSADVVQISHRQCINKYSQLCPQNINLQKLVGDNIWPASRNLLAPDLYVGYFFPSMSFIELLICTMLWVSQRKECDITSFGGYKSNMKNGKKP